MTSATDVQVRLLGPVDVLASGRAVPVPGARRRSVLAVLALRAGQSIAVDAIIDAVWGDRPPATARNTVQAHIAALRRLLPVERSLIRRLGQGYLLQADSLATDAEQVRDLLRRVDAEADPARRLPLLEQAAGLWRGDPLVDVAASDRLRREASALTDLRQSVMERLVADQLRLGAHRAALPAAQQLVAADPLNERAAELLLLALYRSGHAADALTASRRVAEALRDELDVEPSASLQRLVGRIRDRDPRLLLPGGWSAGGAPGAAASPGGRRGRRPPFVGRERELATVSQLLARERLVTIVGMTGVGKSSLARELVDRARAAGSAGQAPARGHGVEYVDVSAARQDSVGAAGLVAQICERLDVHAESGVAAVQALAARLDDGERLLVLDGWTGSPEDLAVVVADLLSRTRRLRCAVTCDRPLGVAVERQVRLGPLAVPEPGAEAGNPGVELLLHSARLADPSFDAAGWPLEALGDLCRQVGGLPLALALVGARLPGFTAAELAEVLDERVLAWTGHPLVPAHHLHLGALIERLLADLAEAEASLLERLSFLRGGTWALDAARLCGSGDGAGAAAGEQVLARLAERSLVVVTDVEGRSWVSVHCVVARFVQDRLHRQGRHLQQAHAWSQWMQERVLRAARDWHGPREPQALHGCTMEAANVRAMLEHLAVQRPQDLCRAVGALWWWWYRAGMAEEGRRWAARAVAAGGDGPVDLALACSAAGYLAWLVDDYDAAVQHARLALDVGADDDAVTGLARGVLARALGDTADFAGAADEARLSIAAYERAADTWGAAWSQRLLASALIYMGAPAEAVRACDRARRAFEAVGDAWGVAGALDLCSRAVARTGDRARARELATAAVEALQACGDTSNERYALQQLAESAWADGDVASARLHAGAALTLAQRHGYQVGELQALLLLADIAAVERDSAEAEALRARTRRLAALLGPAAQVSLQLARGRAALGVTA